MKKLGWDCYVVHGNRYAGETQLKSINAGSRVHEYLHALGSMLFDKHGLYSSSQTRKLIGKIRNLKFLQYFTLIETVSTITTGGKASQR